MDLERIDVDTGDVTLSCLALGQGPVVLAWHGFPDRRESFLPVAPRLVAAGFRVILPALRGYRPSGVARRGRHDALAAAEDTRALADHFAPGQKVRLVGHDWGAVVSFAAVARWPERFSHLATMAVPHPATLLARLSIAQLRRSWYMGLFQLPRIAEARLARDDFALVDRLWRDWSPGYRPSAEEMRGVKDGIAGRVGPVVSYYRALRSPSVLREAKPMFGKVRVPAIHLHGEDDGCIGVELSDGAERHYEAGYALHRIAGAGHFLVQEKAEEVGRILAGFLGEAGSSAP
jgi:pimeloyl-ACP methyl ester carboxylesterase